MASVGRPKRHVTQVQTTSKTPRGFISVCAWCRRIRNSGGGWELLDIQAGEDPDIRETHGICPVCAAKLKRTAKKLKTPQRVSSKPEGRS